MNEGVSFIDSPHKMSQFDIEEYENTVMREVWARNYLLSHQKECYEQQSKQDKLLRLEEDMIPLHNEEDFVTQQREVERAQKVLEEAERKKQELIMKFQVEPYLQECCQYLQEYYDFSGCDYLADIMKSLEHAGKIRIGVRMMLIDLRSQKTVKEEDLNRYDPILIIALAHALYYIDQDFETEFYIRERISDYSDIYSSAGSIIINQNEESPEGTSLDKIELTSKKKFLQEFWKFENIYHFNLKVSLEVIWPEVKENP